MITRPTTLVLGAGASAPFGFPLGGALYDKVAKELKDQGDPFFRLMCECGFSADVLTRFRDALYFSGKLSIDAFLEGRFDEPSFMEIGKTAMAAKLLPFEGDLNIFGLNPGENWYRYLWTLLAAPKEKFRGNRLNLITYNYDRSLERFLYISLRNSYSYSQNPSEREPEIQELLKTIPIVHVHGVLGNSIVEEPVFSRPVTADMARESAKTIKVIHEGVEDSPELTQARELLQASENICFLGFGYLNTNLERLRLSDLPDNKRIYGSAKGFHQGQQLGVMKHFRKFNQGIMWGGTEHGVLEFLKQAPIPFSRG